MLNDAEPMAEAETPESETLAYLEALERRAQLKKIRRQPIPFPDESQPQRDSDMGGDEA
jgi:hypothetical protein